MWSDSLKDGVVEAPFTEHLNFENVTCDIDAMLINRETRTISEEKFNERKKAEATQFKTSLDKKK